MSSSTRRDLAIVLVVCALAFGWRLGRLGLIDPDEPFYAQTAVEMLARHDLVTPRIFDHPQFEKPALFYWLACASFAAFGRTEAAARLPGATAAALLVLLTWGFGRRIFGARAGRLAALVLASGATFTVSARIMLTDMVFALFLCASCFAFWRAVEAQGARARAGRWIVLAAVASALAVLTKGPLGILVPGLAVLAWRILSRRPFPAGAGVWGLAAAVWVVVAVPWYAVMIQRHGLEYARAFFVHENFERLVRAEHPANNRLDYYPGVLILGSWPWIPALAVTLMRARRRIAPAAPAGAPRAAASGSGSAALYLAGWFASSFLFFSIAQSKLPTYILFLFVPLALLAGRALDALLRDGFASRAERNAALALAALQALAPPAALLLPAARPFAAPMLAAGAFLLVALALLARGPSPAWVGATVAATLALLVGATGPAADAIEAQTSVRPSVLALQHVAGPEVPVLTSAFLARGLHYYTGRAAIVLSNRDQPFFTPHPLPLVRGPLGLAEFVRAHGATLCVMRAKEWRDIERAAPRPIPGTQIPIGDKVLVRVGPEAIPALE